MYTRTADHTFHSAANFENSEIYACYTIYNRHLRINKNMRILLKMTIENILHVDYI